MITIEEALKKAYQRLQPQSSSPHLDADLLLAFVLGETKSYLYTYPEKILPTAKMQAFEDLLVQRLQGQPIAYLLGSREFWSLPLKVTKETLIPRPETELLVELTLSQVPNDPGRRILDLGTGSGAIALALATERPDWQITAVDVSEGALDLAKENAAALQIKNIQFYHSNWFDNLNDSLKFHAIVSNPPYLSSTDPHLKQGDLRFEPQQALVAGPRGLESLKIILANSLARLVPQGLLLVEHGHLQKEAIWSMLYEYGYDNIAAWQDYQGRDRISGARKTDS